MMGCNIMTLYLLGLTICTNCWKARTLGASWRWLSLAKNGDFLIGRGNILLNLGGEGGPAALTDKNRRCVSNSTGEDPLGITGRPMSIGLFQRRLESSPKCS